MPVTDCAPLIVAAELNLFRKYGINVQLSREKSWTDVRDKIIHGDLDAAHAPGTLPFVTTLGIGCEPCPCVTSLVLSLQGNAITLSRRLWDRGIRDAAALRTHIYQDWGKKTYTFGVVFRHSTQFFLLQKWLSSAGIVPDVEVRILVIPPCEMFPTLKLGYLDGYCAGEPWTSVAVDAGLGVCVASSTVLAPLHPEKVLMVRQDYAQQHPLEHEKLIAALCEACALCEQPENHRALADILHRPEYVNAPTECLSQDLADSWGREERRIRPLFGSNIFYRFKANEPTEEKAAWIITHLLDALGSKHPPGMSNPVAPALQKVFQKEPYANARRRAMKHLKLIESGQTNLQTLARPLWSELRLLVSRI